MWTRVRSAIHRLNYEIRILKVNYSLNITRFEKSTEVRTTDTLSLLSTSFPSPPLDHLLGLMLTDSSCYPAMISCNLLPYCGVKYRKYPLLVRPPNFVFFKSPNFKKNVLKWSSCRFKSYKIKLKWKFIDKLLNFLVSKPIEPNLLWI